MKPRIVYIHGNGTTDWRSIDWAPWLEGQFREHGYETCFETFPDGIKARSEFWLPHLEKEIGAGEGDVLIGWSSGAVAAMRYAEKHRIRGSVLVSPCYTDLGDASEKESGYYEDPWRWGDIQNNQGQLALVYSEDDPYIPVDEFEFIARKLKPTVLNIPESGHFIERKTFPELLEYILQTYP